MNSTPAAQSTLSMSRSGRQRRWLQAVLLLVLLAGLGLVFAVEYVLHNAEPILRKRILETLSARFDAPVQLDALSISLLKGVEVEGWGLRIPYGAAASPRSADHPLLAVRYFSFRTSLRSLLHRPTRVSRVRVDGMELHVPPPGERGQILGPREGTKPADPTNPGLRPKIAVLVDSLQCDDVRIFIESDKPDPLRGTRAPLEFDIAALDLRDLGPNRAMLYDAQLTNPKPVGLVHAQGHFGPWAGGTLTRNPGQTPLDGDYSFDHADLNTIKGIGGTLSSRGRFSGVLDRIVIDGTTDTPNFSLDISNRPVPLHTEFHAIVDGTDGDTYLQPVRATLENSQFTTTGKVVKVAGAGHDIRLNVEIPHGRMEDFLRLAAKTNPPLMSGWLTMHARMEIPPGKARVPEKIAMTGDFTLDGVRFNNPHLQDRIDGLSARAQGNPSQVKEVSQDGRTEARSQMGANFTIGHGLMTATDVRYAIPGATVLLNGVYSMDGRLFEFKGHVCTQATASQMVGGWKGLLLKPVDRFLEKNGAGVELPIEITGTESDMHFGLAMHGTDQTPAQMLSDIREKQQSRHDLQAARHAAAQADAEDLQAAHAATLEDAERAHDAAVRHRAEAQRKADASKAAGGQQP